MTRLFPFHQSVVRNDDEHPQDISRATARRHHQDLPGEAAEEKRVAEATAKDRKTEEDTAKLARYSCLDVVIHNPKGAETWDAKRCEPWNNCRSSVSNNIPVPCPSFAGLESARKADVLRISIDTDTTSLV